jgi:O-succinylbenzoic acid--CoA ligase
VSQAVRPDGVRCDWLAQRARTSPERLALAAGPRRWSFRQLDAAATRMARELAAAGVAAEGRVAVLMRNGGCFVAATHALGKLGAIMVPLHPKFTPAELTPLLEEAGAASLVCDGALADRAQAAAAALPGLRRVVAADPDPVAGAGAKRRPTAALPPDARSLSSVQCVVYTSATSGRAKGVRLTYGNHWWSAVGNALHLGLHRDDCWLACLSLCRIGGLAILWRSVIYGIPVVLHEAFDPDAVNREIDGGRVTLVSLVPVMLQRVLDARGRRPFPHTLRAILLGGAPAPQGLLEACARRGVPVAPTYGLTETASQVATLAPDEAASRIGSAGRAVFPSEIRIAAPGGSEAPAGETGEILVRGPVVMQGYDGRPDETAEALEGGWLHTGDLGYLDGDGYLYVIDRRTDLIVSGGENVYPAEVEQVLHCHPAVEAACVVGAPDARWGRAVVAAVQLRPGARASAEAITAFCRERLAGYKIPKRIWFVDEIPRSSGGKLLRRCVRDRLLEADISRPASAAQAPAGRPAPE